MVPPKFINFSLYFLIFTFKYKVINLFIVLTVQPLLPNFYSCWVSYVPNRTVPNGTFSKEVLKSEISIYCFKYLSASDIFSVCFLIYILCFLIGFILFVNLLLCYHSLSYFSSFFENLNLFIFNNFAFFYSFNNFSISSFFSCVASSTCSLVSPILNNFFAISMLFSLIPSILPSILPSFLPISIYI